MKKIFLASAAALALLAASPVLAEDQHGHPGGGGGAHGGGAPHGGGGAPHGGGGAPHGGGGAMMRSEHVNRERGDTATTRSTVTTNNTMMTGGTHNRRGADGTDGGGRNTNAIFGTGGHGFHAAPGRHVDHDSAQIRQLSANRSASQRFHAGSYRAPRGYSYRRWSYGDVLPALFFTSDYWLTDYNDYGLPYAPPGTIWVRYGDDALLVDRYTGEIIQADYGVFY